MGMIIDGFCGGMGGAGFGIEAAFNGHRHVSIAINHDPEAIRMYHSLHSQTECISEDIWKVNLPSLVPDGEFVDLAWFSPDCRSFSIARGAAPKSTSIRMLPWSVYAHAKAINPHPRVVILENVREIRDWAKLSDDGTTLAEPKGSEFKRFVKAMRQLGYQFEDRILNAADYGAPTKRERWYGIFRADGLPIVWPAPTHSRNGSGGLEPWKQCGDYIDFSDLGRSLFFGRTKPLAEKTLTRIGEGIKKYVASGTPYLIKDPRAYEYAELMRPDLTKSKKLVLSGFLTEFYGRSCGQSLNSPLGAITTSGAHHGLIVAFLTKFYGHSIGQSLYEPLGTITTKDRFALCSVLIESEPYEIGDVFLRMLSPEEYKVLQGFSPDVNIKFDAEGKPYSRAEQVKRIGNSVVPAVVEAIIRSNCSFMSDSDVMDMIS